MIRPIMWPRSAWRDRLALFALSTKEGDGIERGDWITMGVSSPKCSVCVRGPPQKWSPWNAFLRSADLGLPLGHMLRDEDLPFNPLFNRDGEIPGFPGGRGPLVCTGGKGVANRRGFITQPYSLLPCPDVPTWLKARQGGPQKIFTRLRSVDWNKRQP